MNCQGELPADLGQTAVPHLAQAGDCLGPAEGLLGGVSAGPQVGVHLELRVLTRRPVEAAEDVIVIGAADAH
jgi:hypothetical protein